MKYILGIDVGTSNVKAVLFDEGGQEVRVASRESETINGAGNHVEQDMYVVWENVKVICHTLAEPVRKQLYQDPVSRKLPW